MTVIFTLYDRGYQIIGNPNDVVDIEYHIEPEKKLKSDHSAIIDSEGNLIDVVIKSPSKIYHYPEKVNLPLSLQDKVKIAIHFNSKFRLDLTKNEWISFIIDHSHFLSNDIWNIIKRICSIERYDNSLRIIISSQKVPSITIERCLNAGWIEPIHTLIEHYQQLDLTQIVLKYLILNQHRRLLDLLLEHGTDKKSDRELIDICSALLRLISLDLDQDWFYHIDHDQNLLISRYIRFSFPINLESDIIDMIEEAPGIVGQARQMLKEGLIRKGFLS